MTQKRLSLIIDRDTDRKLQILGAKCGTNSRSETVTVIASYLDCVSANFKNLSPKMKEAQRTVIKMIVNSVKKGRSRNKGLDEPVLLFEDVGQSTELVKDND